MKAEDILSEVLRRYEEALKKRGVSAKTLADAQDLSGKLGKDLGRILAEELLRAFPAGAVPEDVAMGVIPAALRRNSDVVSGFVREIQKRLNEAARVPAPVESRFRKRRAENLAKHVAHQEDFSAEAERFRQFVESNSRMVVDDAVRDQAFAHRSIGLTPTIKRTAAPGCCKWCTEHAGTVEYGPGMNKEIFQRHPNCPCLIEYDPADGARKIERVENYRFDKDMDPDEIELRKQIGQSKYRGKDVTAEYFGTATPGKGTYKQDDDVEEEDVRMAKILFQTFGGDIHVKERIDNIRYHQNPDYEWRGKLWDLKTTHTDLAAKSATKGGLKQIKENPGGLVIDMVGSDRNLDRTIVNIEDRVYQTRVNNFDILIMQNGKLIKALRYNK